MNILGISGQERDAAAALIRDGVVVAAIEEEKLARVRHVGMTYSGGLPVRAIEFCLEQAGIKFGDVDYVTYYLEPSKLFRRSLRFRAGRMLRSPGLSSIQAFTYHLVESLNNLRQRLRTTRLAQSNISSGGRCVTVNHQLAHGAGAFYSSGFERSAVMAAGGMGDMTSFALLRGAGAGLTLDSEAPFPDSLGMVYDAVTEALGFSLEGEEHKTMWLAPTGENEFDGLFKDLIGVTRDGLPKINLDYFDPSFSAPSLSPLFFEKTGLKPRAKDGALTRVHRNTAASLQTRLEDVMVEIASLYRERTGEENLCISGGVALNSLANSAIERRAGFKQVFVQTAPGNAGCAVGAALYHWHHTLGNQKRSLEKQQVFLGPKFGEEDIKKVLDNCKLSYEYFLTEDKLIAEVAQALKQGWIAGWFNGAMEFGPRTLGARSILASPLLEMMGDNLNTYIKHREEFRPFSASVPEERALEYFEASNLTEFLQGVSRIKQGKRDLMPAAIFGDGLVRVHTVSRTKNPVFWKLLSKFGELTGVPVLLNTSFNLFGEPVVSNPREAVRGFYCSGIDCLALGNFLVKK